MRHKAFVILLTAAACLLNGCEQEGPEARPYPQAKTLGVNAITSEGACFNGEIMNPAGYEITDHGFVFSTSSDPTYDYSTRIALGANSAEGPFSTVISSNLRTDVEYYVKAWVKTTDKVMLGLPVKFVSLGSKAPVVNGFFPKTGTWNDTITITGKNFGHSQGESVTYFGTVTSRAISVNDTILETVVPFYLSDDSCLIAVEVIGNRSTAKEKFVLYSPAKILDFSPKEAEWMDTVTLNGIFPAAIPVNIFIDTSMATIVYKNENMIKAIIPVNAMSYEGIEIFLSFNNHGIYSNEKLFIKRPYIQAMQELKGKTGDTITLTGLFNPDSKNTNILLDGVSLSLLRCQKNELKFKMPSPVNSLSPSIVISSGGIILNENAILEYEKPQVTSISATEINTFSTIQINGTGFLPNKTTILFDDIPLTILSIEDNKIIAKPVQSLVTKTYALKVRVLDYVFETGHKIFYGIPEITSFVPKEATFLDTVTIYFRNIVQKNVKVRMGDFFYPNLVFQDNEKIKIIVPDRLDLSHYYLYLLSAQNIVLATSPIKFSLKRPIITDFTPHVGFLKQPIEIYGQYFCPVTERNSILVGEYKADITESSASKISAIIPNIPAGTYTIRYKTADLNILVTDSYSQTSIWTIIGEKPDNSVGDKYFAHLQDGGRFYMIGGVDCSGAGYFDINSKIWHDVTDFPGGKRSSLTGFTLNNNIYAGLGRDVQSNYYSDLYKFSPATGNWTKASSFPGLKRQDAVVFVINDIAYVGGGYNGSYLKSLYKFEPITNQWEKTTDLPAGGESPLAVVAENKAYLFYYYTSQLWVFDPSTSQFTQKSLPYVDNFNVTSAFVINEKIYTIILKMSAYTGEWNFEFWTYDILSENWTSLYDIPILVFTGRALYCVSYNGKGYMFVGDEWDQNGSRKFFEYDPSKEP